MAQALASGLAPADWIQSVCFIDPDDQAAAAFALQSPLARRYGDPHELAIQADVIVLAVKDGMLYAVSAANKMEQYII